jgi:parallel beta-helix repeat protein
MGANYSFISSNIVENNAGGILISDETAGSYSNVIEGNTIENNPFDGGITLASDPPAALTGRLTPFGVTNNTIAGNISSANGLQGGGAGVGIFDSALCAHNSGNVVINNTVTNNGLPGIAIHSLTSGGSQIVSNTISGNGADMSNGTTVSTGINVFALLPSAYSTVIVSNKISNESLDVAVNTPTNVEVHLNNLQGKGVGIENSSTGRTDATENWWGCAGGPGAKGCSTVSSPTGTVASTPFANKRF